MAYGGIDGHRYLPLISIAESGRSPVRRLGQIGTEDWEILGGHKRDGTAEPVSRDQILRSERGRSKNHFPCSADHEQDWQPYPVDPYSCYM